MPYDIQAGNEDAIFRATAARLRKAVARSLRDGERLKSLAFVTTKGGDAIEDHGIAYGRIKFAAVINNDEGEEEEHVGWYGLSLNAESDSVAAYETIDWL